MDVISLIQDGQEILQKEHAAEEKTKLGQSRIGSIGVLTKKGVLGECLRKAYLRRTGIETTIDNSLLTLFDGGYANEEAVLKNLRKGGEANQLEVDSDFSFRHALASGRPDIVLKKDGTPVHLIELKSICSFYSAKNYHFDMVPDKKHLAQAGAYMMWLGESDVTGSLLYSSRVYWHIPPFLAKMFLPGCYDVDFKGDRAYRVRPFNREYKLQWKDDSLTYISDGMSEERVSPITKQGIEDFYTRLSSIKETDLVDAPPLAVDATLAKSFAPCDYCDLSDVCGAFPKTYKELRESALKLPNVKEIK